MITLLAFVRLIPESLLLIIIWLRVIIMTWHSLRYYFYVV